jgi:competence protein ComEC
MFAWRRRLGPWSTLAIAAIVLFAADPLAVLGAGFWLSILAVAGLIGAAWGRLAPVGTWRALIAAQWGVALALLVPGLLVFGGIPAYGPVANLVAVPLFGLLVVPLALAGLLGLAVADPVAAVSWTPAAALIDGMLAVLGWMSDWPGAWVPTTGPPAGWLGAAGVAAAALLLPLPRSTRAACAILAVPLVCWRPVPLPAGAYRVSVLDVGQGLAVVVRTRRHTLVFDTGPAWRGGGDAGAAMVVPFLAAAGVERIDALVLSHGDGDHRGGTDSLVRNYPPASRWFGPDVPPRGGAARRCAAGEGWRWDGVEFRFLHPPRVSGLAGNDSSCVMRVTGPGGRTLLTGDIEAPAEAALVGGGSNLAADLVVAPHHGSRTSSTTPFVVATGARWVIFPAGRHNRWGFPASDVVARWRTAGARVWTTGDDGAVQLLFDAAGPVEDPRGWRCERRRFWRPADCTVPGRVPGPNDSQYHLPDPAPTRKGPDG